MALPPLTLRSEKGSRLNVQEFDDNHRRHEQRIDTLESATPEAMPPSNMTVVGSQWTIHYPSVSFGPFTLPQLPFVPSVVGVISTETHTPVLSDANTYKRCTHTSGCLVMVPTNDEVPFPINTELGYRQTVETGPVSFDAPTDVLIHDVPGFLHRSAQKGATVVLKKVATNEWEVTGWLAPGEVETA